MSVGMKNTTGTPSAANYNLGRGRAYIAPLVSGLPYEFRDLGNVPGFSLSVDVEELLHQSSREGVKTTDARVVISQDVGFTLTLDELSAQNLALFFAGTVDAGVTNPAVAGITEYLAIPALVETGGFYLQIQNATGVPARDIDASDVTVTHDKAGANDTLVLNTDYTVDTTNGMIFFLSTGVVTTVGKTIHVTLAAKAGAVATMDQTLGLAASSATYALKFIGVNPLDEDSEMQVELHKIRISAEGDFALIGDEITQMQVTGTAERNTDWVDSDSQTMTITKHQQS
jgi:hypothetical protein